MIPPVSTFTWLDNSEHDRRRALEVIDLFSMPGTLDELGIGTIRDALADHLFPGTSTIQTRASYFLFIPWIYRKLEAKAVGSATIAEKARDREIRLASILTKAETEASGVIGSEAGKKLKRLPSAVYWGGMRTWGIRARPGSQDQYHRSLDRLYLDERIWRDSARDREGKLPPPHSWHAHLPAAPSDFPDGASFALRRIDAEYLKERICACARGSLLAYLVDADFAGERATLPWDHTSCDDLPTRLRLPLEHARNFSEAHHGAALLYNLMLAEARPLQDRVDDYRTQFSRWAELISERNSEFHSWDRERFWNLIESKNNRISPGHRRFVDTWLDLLLAAQQPASLVENEQARQLIEDREYALKRSRAKLKHREYLETWGGASGADRLSYRWNTVQTLLADIHDGLTAEEPHAISD